MNTNLRFRQAHLDFHTSAQCMNVGVDFNADTFVETLKIGHVNSINIFARCCHGYSYYPTKVGTMHPNLKFDLLGSQIEGLHKADIKCPIYMPVKWDDLAGSQHPEWLCVNKEGKMLMRHPLSNEWGWTTVDLSSSYADYVTAQVEELFQFYGKDIDGFWFDLCFPMPNYSPWGQAQMIQAGVNLENDQDVWTYARMQDLKFFDKMTKLVQSKNPQATIWYNGTIDRSMGEMLPYLTQFEIESDPIHGSSWGYMHFPVFARQARSYGKEFIALTGRFHRSWSDFGGLKTKDQLAYEVGTILAAGGRICVGDQLHPKGTLDPAVYRMLGEVYSRVEKLEPWLYGTTPTAEVAIINLGQPVVSNEPGVGKLSEDVEGATQVLLESAIQFDIIDHRVDINKYPAVILPHSTVLDETWKRRLKSYLKLGGKLVLSGTAGLDPATRKFALEEIPVEFIGNTPTTPSYIRLDQELTGNTELSSDFDYVFYDQSYLVGPKNTSGISCFGDIRQALFNREWNHFTGHRHAAVGESMHSPVVIQNDKVLYFAAPLFTAYRNYDFWVYRALLQNALRKFLTPLCYFLVARAGSNLLCMTRRLQRSILIEKLSTS